jgi:hypothetical protein
MLDMTLIPPLLRLAAGVHETKPWPGKLGFRRVRANGRRPVLADGHVVSLGLLMPDGRVV